MLRLTRLGEYPIIGSPMHNLGTASKTSHSLTASLTSCREKQPRRQNPSPKWGNWIRRNGQNNPLSFHAQHGLWALRKRKRQTRQNPGPLLHPRPRQFLMESDIIAMIDLTSIRSQKARRIPPDSRAGGKWFLIPPPVARYYQYVGSGNSAKWTKLKLVQIRRDCYSINPIWSVKIERTSRLHFSWYAEKL